MNAYELLQAMGQAQDAYILDAETARRDSAQTTRPLIRRLAAVLAIVLAGILFLQTPMGAAAAEMVKEQFTKLIDLLFPPKDLLVYPEGDPETVLHEVLGREPDTDTAGFAIYVDTSTYTMTEEAGIFFIRPIAASDTAPACEIEIQEIPSKAPFTAVQEIRDSMAGNWESVSEIWVCDEPAGHFFSVSSGSEWCSPREVHYFTDSGTGGSFHIISRYFLEATEGHGTRFTTMIRTFSVVAPQDAAQYEDSADALLSAMRQEVAHAKSQSDALLLELENADLTQADMNAIAEDRYSIWLGVMDKLWTALEQTLDEEAMSDLMAAQMEWSNYKKSAVDQATAELEGGSLSATAACIEGAALLEPRVYALLNTLEGTAPILSRDTDSETDPQVIVTAFAQAYFSDDVQTIRQYYTDLYGFGIDVYPEAADDISAIYIAKGMDSVIRDMAHLGRLDASVEFRPNEDRDYFVYLSITLNWIDGQWQVTSYGLEG